MNTTELTRYIPDEATMLRFGKKLAETIVQYQAERAVILYFNGDLGAGKTTLTRGMVQGLGHKGNVKSPTYTLVEEYNIAGKMIYHFDLYRLADPEELEFMGIRDYFGKNSICLIEWAEKGEGILPPADLLVNIDYYDDARNITLTAQNTLGEQIIQQL
ncbi:tRNA (adenosine(37)-N6)-threonylcarbamoyltransferase complex ATPase subunit type 1 TsaE [Rodentibacter haemolyticus]|uniref:tRNA threonylcarbamoyladenosine biosynthesis protein TsaE n=1 Tax=Rodentibacter haemolyticus TaxID=2778911 RepID=A0ABX6V069_9PAST|nr:tRNA (adenosine(37)-N6)-threonylcarbamoyltransferase complex ATPase subunit type 1 TsaE [Rodentibacter haemolyticus]QPB43109.1 tRNA (adenosine(37)-N6)-threonylcarbamoyltransferase complex ATPase subunit type 1 TsaE [Rodentibacter haemolyticus]